MMRFCFLFALIVLVACSPSTDEQAANPTEEPFYAWDFSLTSLDGATYTLSEMRGEWIIINFWATDCPPCVAEMPALQAIADQYAERLTVLGVNHRESEATVRDFLARHDIRFPILMNPTDVMLTDYQVIGLPQTLIVDPDGELIWRQFGPVELDTFNTEFGELIGDEVG